ncbi:MAG TPA: hypothetical protein VJP83_02450, partial [Terriglobales bacterium]|nr:hypothetical protein [Terriglobales bacterium]
GSAVLDRDGAEVPLVSFHWSWPLLAFARIWLGAEPMWRSMSPTPHLVGQQRVLTALDAPSEYLKTVP